MIMITTMMLDALQERDEVQDDKDDVRCVGSAKMFP